MFNPSRGRVASIVLGLWLSGCSISQRVEQCNELARTVNAGLTPVQEQLEADSALEQGEATPESYAKLAAQYTELAKSIEALALEDEKLRDIKLGYQALFEQAAEACRTLQKARSKAEDETEYARAVRDVGRLNRRQDSLAARVKLYCESP